MQELTLLKGKLYFEELYPQLYNMYEFIMYTVLVILTKVQKNKNIKRPMKNISTFHNTHKNIYRNFKRFKNYSQTLILNLKLNILNITVRKYT